MKELLDTVSSKSSLHQCFIQFAQLVEAVLDASDHVWSCPAQYSLIAMLVLLSRLMYKYKVPIGYIPIMIL